MPEAENKIAQQAFQTAYCRETSSLIHSDLDRASSIENCQIIWQLHDLLSIKRYEIGGKYEYGAIPVAFDFANFIKEGWLSLEDL